MALGLPIPVEQVRSVHLLDPAVIVTSENVFRAAQHTSDSTVLSVQVGQLSRNG